MRCRRWLAASCFILASAVGCTRSEEPVQSGTAPAPQEARISPEEQEALRRSEHDEPIVIDNAPMKIFLSKEVTQQADYAWTRHFHKFATLHIVPRDMNGDPIGDDFTRRLCYDCPVTLVMKENGNQPMGNEERVVLTTDGQRSLTMKPAREYAKGNNNRFIPKNSPQLRLVAIEYTDRDTNTKETYPLAETNDYRYRSVEIVLIGTTQ